MKRTVPAVILGLLLAILFCRVGAGQANGTGGNEPKLVDFQDLAYPTLARSAHIQGIVVIRATLDGSGNVVDAEAISGAEPLVPDSLANAKKWKFQPNARKLAVIVYNFRLTAAISKSGCSHFMLEPPNFATITGCVPGVQ
jgi:TonB family protein